MIAVGLGCSEGDGVEGALLGNHFAQPWVVLADMASFQQGLLGANWLHNNLAHHESSTVPAVCSQRANLPLEGGLRPYASFLEALLGAGRRGVKA